MRRYKGTAIVELGPALLVVLVCILVPLLDLVYLGTAFAFSYFLHNLEIRELATNIPNGTVDPNNPNLNRADEDFVNNSFGVAAFVGINSSNLHSKITHPHFGPSSFTPGPSAVQPGTVTLTTQVNIRPWLYLPILQDVPGIGRDMPFTFTDTKPEDENGQN